MIAIGVYLRKLLVEYISNESPVCLDAGSFGKIYLVNDPDAGDDSLYPKKLVYEPMGVLRSLSDDKPFVRPTNLINKPLDMVRLARVCRNVNQNLIKKNID